jgi:peptide/nickel transport system substrate-binding protein
MPVSFRSQAVLALAGVALLLVLVAGSGGRAGSAKSGPTDGGTYVEAMVGAPRLVNPLLATSDTDTDLAHLVFSGLTRVDGKGNIVPDMAREWQVSPDATVYTFTLKPNVRWQDNEPFTSDDVFFTIHDLLQSPDFKGDPTLAQAWHDIQVSVPTRQIVSFALATPDASFIQFTTLGILPRHLWGNIKPADMASSELNQAPVGSGPWRYVGESPAATDSAPTDSSTAQSENEGLPGGEGVMLEPNPYAPSALPKIARLWFREYPTFGAALSGFEVGEVHGLGHIPPDRLTDVESLPEVTVHSQALARYTMLILNVRSSLFDKSETRQALEMAIDRDALVKQSLGGQAVPAESPVLAQSWAYDPLSKHTGYDPAQARRLLDAAGWVAGQDGIRARGGMTLTVVLTADEAVPADVAVSKQVAIYLRQIGVDVKLALVSRDRLLHDYLGPRAFHLVLVSWEAQGADPDVFDYWHSTQRGGTSGLNFSGWSNPEADRALEGTRSTPDKALRAKAYAEFQRVFLEDVPGIVLYSPLYSSATRPPAQGVALPDTDLLGPAERFDTMGEWSLGTP